MIRYQWRSAQYHLRQTPSLFVLAVVGVALGVASVMAIQLINRSAIGAFSASLQAVGGPVQLMVVGRQETFSEELLPRVLGSPGIRSAWPVFRADVALDGERPFFIEILGIDVLAPTRLPRQAGGEDLIPALFEPGWLAVSPALAGERGWVRGDVLAASSGTRRIRMVVGGLFDFQRVNPLASRRLCLMDIAQLQDLMGERGRIHEIHVELEPDEDTGRVGRSLQDRLGPSVRVVTPEQQEREAGGLMSAFRLNLTALSLISLFVGLFVVYTSTQAALLRRRREFGVLRSLGATRSQVLRLILTEVAAVGVLGVALGLPIGYWVADANLGVVSSTLTNLYLLEAVERLDWSHDLWAVALVIGLSGAVGGAFLPALDMSRRDPRSLFGAWTLTERITSLSLPLFLGGWGLLGLVLGWYFLWGNSWQPAGFVLAVAVLFTLPLVTPWIVYTTCSRIRVRGFGWLYSLKSLALRLQTASFAVASLAIAVSMLVGLTLMIGSFRRTVELWVDSTVQGDVYVSSVSWRGATEGSLSPQVVEALSSFPGVTAVDRLRRLRVSLGDRPLSLTAVDMDLADGLSRFPLLDGDPERVRQELLRKQAVLITEPLARKRDLKPGDRLVVFGQKGEVAFEVAGVYYDYSSELGAAVMDHSAMVAGFGPGPLHSLALYLEGGRAPEQLVDELRAEFSTVPLRIRSNRMLRQEVFRIFDQTFAVVRILEGMSLLIAVCGITLTLLVLARERSSEVALYRALGARRRQVFQIFVGKGLGMGLMGAVLGTVAGVGLAAILIGVINRSYFGWTIQVYGPGWSLFLELALILGAALVASLYPALQASSTPATQLSRDET